MGDRRLARLRLAVPWLTTAFAARMAASGARARAAEWLVARGRIAAPGAPEWRRWLLQGFTDGDGLLRRFPAGPCVRAAAIGTAAPGVWGCARPVHLLTAIDHLQLASPSIDLAPAETEALIAGLNQHFGGRGFQFHRPANGVDWQLQCTEAIECDSVEPVAAVGRNVRELLPGGRDGLRVSALINEIQMLLHAHPLNEARTARGLPAVNSLWLWGFGQSSGVSGKNLPPLWTDDAWLAGIWRLHGSGVAPLAAFAAQVSQAGGDAWCAWAQPPGDDTATAGAKMESVCMEAARAWLSSAGGREVSLLLGERPVVVDARARLRCWRRARPLGEILSQ